MNLWTLLMMYLILNTILTGTNIMLNQKEVNRYAERILLFDGKLRGWGFIILAIALGVLVSAPFSIGVFIYYLVKGSFK